MLEAIKMYFLPYLINSFFMIVVIHSINQEKVIYTDKRNYFVLFLFTFSSIICTLLININLKMIVMFFVIFIGSKIVSIKSIKELILTSFFCQILFSISELFYVIILILFNNVNLNVELMNFFELVVSNIFIGIISLMCSRLFLVKKIYLKLKKITIQINNSILLFYFLLLVLVTNVYFAISYYKTGINNFIIINIFFMTIYFTIAVISINEKNENIKFKEKNQMLIDNLNEYEKMLDYQRVTNHENKNQLLVIKSMIEKNKDNVIEYVNEIIKEKREDNEIIYNKAKRIPSGGLQGLIYQKMLLMQEKGIEINLDINSQIRKIDFGTLSSKMNYDICRIAGIIIDNAIEETLKFNKKEREIIISMYLDDEFVIEVSNRIKDNIDINKIYDKGYTSKEKGHGYGLSLLKKIVDENCKINNEVKIINNIFTQIIKIKM